MIQVLGLALLMCLALAAMMAYLGIHVLKREIIFIDIALAQLAAVGAIVAHLAFHAHEGSALSFLVAFAFVLLAAAFYAFARRKVAQIPVEAVIGVSYAITAARGILPNDGKEAQDTSGPFGVGRVEKVPRFRKSCNGR